jgi:saccharopine dehydrogenase (NAD+, L-lysine-forming)
VILLYGATGYTGKLVAHELARRGADFAISGRSRDKLDALAASLPRAERVSTRVADAADPARLRAVAEGARVVLSCAGPFTLHGKAVQDAALDARAHFFDVTGEQAYMRATFARDAEAHARGVALVNAVGFDVVPTDLAVHLATKGLGRARLAELALSVTAGGASRGTIESAMLLSGGEGTCFHDGAWRAEPIVAHRRTVRFPEPVGPRECVSLPLADIATAPRTTGARDVRMYVRLPPRLARALPLAHRAWQLAEKAGVRRLTRLWSRRLPEGPDADRRAATRFAIWARVESEDGRSREVTALGADPYGLTAITAAHAAMAYDGPAPRPTGALTPAQALDPESLRAELEAFGTRYVVGEPS